MSLAETQTGLVGVMTHPIGNPDCLTVDFFLHRTANRTAGTSIRGRTRSRLNLKSFMNVAACNETPHSRADLFTSLDPFIPIDPRRRIVGMSSRQKKRRNCGNSPFFFLAGGRGKNTNRLAGASSSSSPPLRNNNKKKNPCEKT